MSSRYDVIGPDTLEEMRRAGHAAKLETRIEKLEAALREIAYGPHDVDASYAILFGTITTKAIKALEGKDV